MDNFTVEDNKLFFEKPLTRARIINRPNRFIVNALIDGKEVKCHCPVTGRIGGYTLDGLPCLLSGPHGGSRSTAYTVEAFSTTEEGTPDFQWIGINQTAANGYISELLKADLLAPMIKLKNKESLKREKKLGHSRIDFFLNGDTYLEVKMPLTIIQLSAPHLEVKDFKPTIGVDRMITQLEEMTSALNSGEKAIMLSLFAYDFPASQTPGATAAKNFKPLPSMVAAKEAGLERWQVNLLFNPDGIELTNLLQIR